MYVAFNMQMYVVLYNEAARLHTDWLIDSPIEYYNKPLLSILPQLNNIFKMRTLDLNRSWESIQQVVLRSLKVGAVFSIVFGLF